jgi:ribose transport system permease protein
MVQKRRLNFGLDRFSGLYLLAAFIIIFGVWTPSLFLSMSTVHLIASTQAVSAIIALAVLIPMICGQYDLSVGANANLTGMVAVVLQVEDKWPLLPTLLVSILIGIIVGIVNGFIVVRLRVNSFIATLGMGSVLTAAMLYVTNSQQLPVPLVAAWNRMTQYPVFGFQVIIYYLLVMVLIAWWVVEFTPVGRHMRAAGGNPDAARLSGIRTNRLAWWSLIASGAIVGIGGILYTSLTGPSLTFGPDLLLPAFAAVFLGSTQLQPGRFNVWGTMLAIFVLATGIEGLELVSGAPWVGDLFNGVALILAVALAASRQGKPTRLRRRAIETADLEKDTQDITGRRPPQAAAPSEDPAEAKSSASS